jgi:subtilisin family serine protease
MSLTYALRLDNRGFAAELGGLANYASIEQFLARLARALGYETFVPSLGNPFPRLLGFPLLDWGLWADPAMAADPAYALARLRFRTQADVEKFLDLARRLFGEDTPLGADPLIAPADLWTLPAGGGAVFGDRGMAHALINAGALPAQARGAGVHVFIVDCGIEQAWVQATKARHGAADAATAKVFGWTRLDRDPADSNNLDKAEKHFPGQRRSPHGELIARAVLALAPEATIWDVPLIGDPARPPYLTDGVAALAAIRHGFATGRFERFDPALGRAVTEEPGFGKVLNGRAVVVNAWGVFDTGQARHDIAGYGDDPDHVLTREAPGLDAAGIDIVFCAGNCGEPIPDARCGELDRGAGRSSSGLNAHPNVLSVGAVRPDGLPVALSSQGPGRLFSRWPTADAPGRARAREKPDLCAPSHFRDDDDGSLLNTGSSAAAGVAAGVVAALRSLPGAGAVSPAELRAILRQTAQRPGEAWDPQLGWGVIDCAAAVSAVRQLLAAQQSA